MVVVLMDLFANVIIIILDIQHVIQIEIVGYKNLNNFINMQGVNNNCKNSNIKIINMMCIKLFKNCIKDKKRSKIIIKKIRPPAFYSIL